VLTFLHLHLYLTNADIVTAHLEAYDISNLPTTGAMLPIRLNWRSVALHGSMGLSVITQRARQERPNLRTHHLECRQSPFWVNS
jgi:hypothetical protein